MLLGKPPKDFDVVTTANLKQIKDQLRNVRIVGRRFPICRIYVKGSFIEVSSFETALKNTEDKLRITSEMQNACNHDDFIRWRDSMRRDFTVNSLLYEPHTNQIYDYVNGIKDIKAYKVRTIIPAELSFREDCARILRGIRIAARLDLEFSKETSSVLLHLRSSIQSLDKARLMMEMNYMLAYGAAVPSFLLLQKYKLLEILLPIHAVYLAQQAKCKTGQGPPMLMNLFSSVDKLLSADHSSDCTLWLGLLAFHLALIKQPQDALTVWNFSSVLYHGRKKKSGRFAKENADNIVHYFPEILETSAPKPDKLQVEEVSQFASMVKASISTLISSDALNKAMEIYQRPSRLFGLVFVSKTMGKKVAQLFDIFDANNFSTSERKSYCIDYELLKNGDPNETRFVLGKVIMDALNAGVKKEENQSSLKNEIVGNRIISGSGLGKEQMESISERKIDQAQINNDIELNQKQAFQKLKEEICMRSGGVSPEENTVNIENRKDRSQKKSEPKQEENVAISNDKKERNQENTAPEQMKRSTNSEQKEERNQVNDGVEHEFTNFILEKKKRSKSKAGIKHGNQAILEVMNISSAKQGESIGFSGKVGEQNQVCPGGKTLLSKLFR